VAFHGRVDDEELDRIYASADIYLIPTMRFEGLPLALLEAMSHGIPTISSKIGGNADVITHDFDGLFIKPGDMNELIASIRKLGNDVEIRKKISNAARETTEKRFDKERMIEETLEVLEKMA
jgi:glycosyltransferase involved in cell wall biosynthesis